MTRNGFQCQALFLPLLLSAITIYSFGPLATDFLLEDSYSPSAVLPVSVRDPIHTWHCAALKT